MKSPKKFQVSVEYSLLDGQKPLQGGDKRIAALNSWLAKADEGDAVATAHGWIAKAIVAAQANILSLDHAAIYASKRIAHYVETLGFPPCVVISLSVIDADRYVAELEVYGSREVAELLGISRQRVAQLRDEGTLPEPDAQLAATPVWKKATVEGFMWGWRRKPGPAPQSLDDNLSRLLSGN